ncbi:hypothetical_protein [Candidozyma auris]|uniref:hypothetical_protein n=1 Tax=Candidozyma auris TaxID=498019 RepID=UPI000D2A9758|nr:hypothetical_protein [[Candida] auris]QEO21900.1 hypothetical_protein [[Candida] auris]GBL51688.1 hypothetical protein CAJCM15448_39620 [[Candida] auris]
MALFHNNANNAQPPAPGKRRLSMFTFGSSSSTNTQAKDSGLSTSPNSSQPKQGGLASSEGSIDSAMSSSKTQAAQSSNSTSSGFQKGNSKSPGPVSPVMSVPNSKNNQLGSPVCSPLFEADSLQENPDCNIFERSVQDLSGQVKHEDCIPPALDATAHILTDKQTNLDDVEMVYSNRRNSSVIGLNMALGRPYTPSRKNSVISMSQCNTSSNGNNAIYNSNNNNTGSQSSLTNALPPQSPVSPPKLRSSRSSVSFYSYADMINSDEFARRPSIKHSFSHGMAPTMNRKMSVASNHSGISNSLSCNTGAACGANAPHASNSTTNISSFSLGKGLRKPQASTTSISSQSQLSKQLAQREVRQPGSSVSSKSSSKKGQSSKLNNFLISPESSESEDHEVYYPATSSSPVQRRASVTSSGSNPNADNESLVSSTMGDCIRQCTTDIIGCN